MRTSPHLSAPRASIVTFFCACCLLTSPLAVGQQGQVKLSPLVTCDRGAVRRTIEIIYDNPVTGEGCKVLYDKRQEGTWRKQVLWKAAYERNFCNEKVAELKHQLQRWGWQCEHGDG